MAEAGETMRAAFCPEPGRILLREEPVPRPERPGEVLLRVRRCGICGSDLHWYTGEVPPPPVCPGHEICAVVEALGPGPHRVREGDRVVAEALRACGRCPVCRAGSPQLCPRLRLLGLSAPGGFAERLVTDSWHVWPVPREIDDETAQLAEPLAVGVHAVRLAGVARDDRVLVLGAGTIGLLAIASAREAGAGEIVVSARRAHQCTAALALGATRVVEPSDLLTAAAPEAGFDQVLDTVADPGGSLDQAVLAVRPGGTVVLVGVFTARPTLDAVRLMMREIRLVGSMCYGRSDRRSDFEIALDVLAREGEALREQIVTHRVSFSDLDRGFRLAADKSTGSIKVSVAISEPDVQGGAGDPP